MAVQTATTAAAHQVDFQPHVQKQDSAPATASATAAAAAAAIVTGNIRRMSLFADENDPVHLPARKGQSVAPSATGSKKEGQSPPPSSSPTATSASYAAIAAAAAAPAARPGAATQRSQSYGASPSAQASAQQQQPGAAPQQSQGMRKTRSHHGTGTTASIGSNTGLETMLEKYEGDGGDDTASMQASSTGFSTSPPSASQTRGFQPLSPSRFRSASDAAALEMESRRAWHSQAGGDGALAPMGSPYASTTPLPPPYRQQRGNSIAALGGHGTQPLPASYGAQQQQTQLPLDSYGARAFSPQRFSTSVSSYSSSPSATSAPGRDAAVGGGNEAFPRESYEATTPHAARRSLSTSANDGGHPMNAAQAAMGRHSHQLSTGSSASNGSSSATSSSSSSAAAPFYSHFAAPHTSAGAGELTYQQMLRGRSTDVVDAAKQANAGAIGRQPVTHHISGFSLPASNGARNSVSRSASVHGNGTIGEPRRAIGFDVSGPGSNSSSAAAAAAAARGGAAFGGGSSVLSMDDLAADLGSFSVSSQQERVRVPSSLAAQQGLHAASMPGGFMSTGGIGTSAPAGGNASGVYNASPSSNASSSPFASPGFGAPPQQGFGGHHQSGFFPHHQSGGLAGRTSVVGSWDDIFDHQHQTQQQQHQYHSRYRATSLGPAEFSLSGRRGFEDVSSRDSLRSRSRDRQSDLADLDDFEGDDDAGRGIGGRSGGQRAPHHALSSGYNSGQETPLARTSYPSPTASMVHHHVQASHGGAFSQHDSKALAAAVEAVRSSSSAASQYEEIGRMPTPSSATSGGSGSRMSGDHPAGLWADSVGTNSTSSFTSPSASGSTSSHQGMPPMPGSIGMPRPPLPPALSPQSSFSAQLSDLAFQSLATLGPLAPPQPGFGGGGFEDAHAHGPPGAGPGMGLQELGKGIPLQALPGDMPLYIVEFKQGRTDLYFKQQWATPDDFEVSKGDLVVVEADRGKDLGTVVNDSINVTQVQSFLAHQNSMRAAGLPEAQSKIRMISPKRLYGRATPADTALLYSKAQDEERALQLCVTKVNQRGLPMSVIAAEMQWDRRKLTFYYTANVRVDFRDLVKELFRLYKTRIWMCNIGHPGGP